MQNRIRVEFFGIPRERAGVAAFDLEADTLAEAIRKTAAQFPQLAECCFHGDSLKFGYLANINGRKFISDPATRLHPGDALLILSADAGG
jgi:molybdopterin converting factor small subunit